MGVCRYCGQKAGWFTDVHKACEVSHQNAYQEISATFATAITDKLVPPAGHPSGDNWYLPFVADVWSEVKATIDQIATQNLISSNDCHDALLQGFNDGAEQVGKLEPVSPDRNALITIFCRNAGLTDEEVGATSGSKMIVSSLILWCVFHGEPQLIASPYPHPFNLQGDEVPLMFFGSVLYSQEKDTRTYQGGYGGASIRVGHGIYYHLGGFKGERVDRATLQDIDAGGMLLTTKNLYFGGQHKTFRIPYDHIVSFKQYADGIGFFRDTAGGRPELFTVFNPWPACGWFLFNLCHFLAQPEARLLYARARKA